MVSDYFPEELDARAGSSGSSCGRRAQVLRLSLVSKGNTMTK
jgi:hypothetical protein